ncbi:dihydrofolate reductase [Peptostreptococcus equinus]|uniref:Dihydrofolate reductase n=1 Tax=Peptostreptococcus equinus TaxID=3003601 RepID=A0ABY7JM38_9FIRM|nr:dihydrofolate reductase [Peptostreptococcus sp. CBA3647]WAW14150.1 dihydrofolate reductase [Peptostreptococcus sp. CBA3647]
MNNIYAIVAMTKKTNSIGIDGHMLYHLKDDLKYFKETTMDHAIICGRKTYFSFPKRPLPGRKNIILTRSFDSYEGAFTLHSKDEVLEYAKNNPDEKVFICGGDNVYKQFMDVVSKLYITEIDEEEPVIADSYFPEVDPEIWEVESASAYVKEDGAPKYRFMVYSRK